MSPRGQAAGFFLCSRRWAIVRPCPTIPKSWSRHGGKDLTATLAFALTRDSRVVRMQAAQLLALILAERIVERLEASGYVVMQGARTPGGAPLGRV